MLKKELGINKFIDYRINELKNSPKNHPIEKIR